MSSAPRVTCYSVTLASQVLESIGNTVSLINVIEGLAVVNEGLGQTIPCELISNWALPRESIGSELEVRAAIVQLDGIAKGTSNPEIVLVQPTNDTGRTVRLRLRMQNLVLPPVFGEFMVHMEWRFRGTDEWNRSEASWFLSVDLMEATPVATSD